LGFGLQFGLEVAEYIFILHTQESLDHFKRGSSFDIGGNVGAAVAGIGREAYGAASVGNTCTRPAEQQQVSEDEYNDEDSDKHLPQDTAATFGVAPIVAYAKSQGLYVGVSLEGSRIFTRSERCQCRGLQICNRKRTLCKR
jgi:lipid-binding SYLF domain-containing protein